MSHLGLFFVLLLTLFQPAARAFGAEGAAVQERKFQLKNEISLGGVVLPQHAFYKAAGLELSFTHHFTHFFGWEPIRASLTTRWETHLRKLLMEQWDAEPEDFEEITFLYTSHLHFKPFYGKLAMMNRGLIRAEAYFLLGGGIAFTTWRRVPVASLSVGIRLYMSPRWSLKAEFEEQFLIQDGGVKDNIAVHLAVSRSFR